MSRELVHKLMKLREEYEEYSEELNLTIHRIQPKRSGHYLSGVVNSYIEILCEDLGVSRDYFLNNRSLDVIYYRYSLIAWLKYNSTMSLKSIGKVFGNKDHSTIINTLVKVKNALQPNSYNQELSDVYYKVKEALEQ